jgi:hypothetical protein
MTSGAIHISLALKPLGPGDLVDRSVRFYRRNFSTFLLIASPPVIVGTMLSLGWTLLGRYIFATSAGLSAGDSAFYYLFVGLGNFAIWVTEAIATIVVMGGASRNFVQHLLHGEAVTFRDTYRNTAKRLGSLLLAATLITAILSVAGITLFYIGLLAVFVAIALVAFVFEAIPIVSVVLSVLIGVAGTLGTTWVFFFVASRFAYAAQVMLVEGQSVGAAFSRSFSLASGNATRLMVLFLFTVIATYSALAILYVPLAWYAWAEGVEVFTFGASILPAWYEIAYGLIWQISFILLTPVWMIGLCLLYVDERVRSEGYDIELAASRRLGDMPSVPSTYINPLTPAISASPRLGSTVDTTSRRQQSTLGLD